ncbi:S9 family peptidase [Candidatus Binatus sp.]|uniref:S9 family peptidase n=1 Tax=Candidatus Binatus sp. TaxID=2811406 RepID=UPI003C9DF831
MNKNATSRKVARPSLPSPPIAARKPHQVLSPNGPRDDSYYWLRDDTRKSKEVLNYLNDENAYTNSFLAPTQALQDELFEELVGRIKQDDASVPVLRRGWWYYTRYETGREYPIYARRRRTMSAPEHVMLDGNALAAGKTFYQIGAWSVSPNGRMLAYAEDDVGRRQYKLRVKNLDTGKVLAETVSNIEPNLVWANDNKTLLYVEKDPVTLLSVRVRKHVVGADPAKDKLVYEERDHSYYLRLTRSKSEKYLFIVLRSTLQSEWHYANADDPKLKFRTVIPREPNHEYQVAHIGRDFVLRTNWEAPNYRLVRAPIAKVADKRTWKDVIPARDDAFLQSFEVFRNYVAVNERSGGLMKLHVRSWNGKRDYVIASAEPSYTTQLMPTPGIESAKVRYIYTSLTTQRTTYEYDMTSDRKTVLKTEPVLGGFGSANYRTEYLHATASDGALIPISIAYRVGTKRDGTAPLYQYAYGSYGLSTDPAFIPNWVSLMDRGFVVAIAHVRGGQEMGRAWYDEGRLLNKKNTFTDFIAVTRHLVREKYAARDKVFAQGGSAGGLLMGAIANLAPSDYRGVVANVPFVDIVTTMLDESIPLTTNEFDEWGNPKDKVFYDYMMSYSPYDNVIAKSYPAMLVTSGLWDSQVPYWEAAKWVAKLRAVKTDRHPLLFKINMQAGHGGKSGRFERLRETAIEYQFILTSLTS